jgi:heat shock protein HtpX
MFRFMNDVKTVILLAALMALFGLAGHAIGGQNGMIFALVLGGGMNVVAYFFSDKIALVTMGAKPLSEAQAPEIHHIVARLAERAGIPKPGVYVAPTSVPNAFATGRNPANAVVCLTSGIMQMLTRDELAGVIGHELAHVKHYDMLIGTIAATIAGAISALGYLLWFIPFGGSDREGGNPLAALAVIILAPIAAAIIQAMISRKREYNADSFGAELAGNRMALATALEKLQAENKRHPMELINPAQSSLFIMKPFSAKSMANLFSTHPPVEKRVEALIGRPTTGMTY